MSVARAETGHKRYGRNGQAGESAAQKRLRRADALGQTPGQGIADEPAGVCDRKVSGKCPPAFVWLSVGGD